MSAVTNNRTFFAKLKSSTYVDAPISRNIPSEIIHISINPSGTRLITSRTDRSIRIWRCTQDKLSDPVIIESPHLKAVERVSWHPLTEHTFASVGRDELVKIWRGNSGKLIREIRVQKQNAKDASNVISQCVDYSSDGEILSVVDRDSTITFYSVKNDYAKVGETVVNEHVYDFMWFNQGHQFFMCALHDGTIPLYELQNDDDGTKDNKIAYKLRHTLTGHRSSATCVALDPRGKYVAVGSNDGVVSVWSTGSMINDRVISEVDEAVASVDISRDGAYLAVAFDSGSNVRVYDHETTQEVYEIPNSTSGNLALSQVKWFPNKTAFVYTSDNGRTMTVMRRAEK